MLFKWLFFILLHLSLVFGRVTQTVTLPSVSPGTRRFLVLHHYGVGDETTQRAYIQACLHADEIPGLLVTHHLIKLLDEAELRGDIQQKITIVPFANPIGLSQQILESHSMSTATLAPLFSHLMCL